MGKYTTEHYHYAYDYKARFEELRLIVTGPGFSIYAAEAGKERWIIRDIGYQERIVSLTSYEKQSDWHKEIRKIQDEQDYLQDKEPAPVFDEEIAGALWSFFCGAQNQSTQPQQPLIVKQS